VDDVAKPSKKKTTREQPRWQPISRLPLFAQHIDGMLAADIEQYETLQEAKPKPWVLDNSTVNRVKQAFTKQRQDFHLFEEQLRRWQTGPLTDDQRQEVERLAQQMKKIRGNNTKVLELAEELGKGTIEKQLAKSDLELGMEVLLNPDLLRRNF
jgi:hypothetical protein